jgi:SnoaL-like domain
MTPEMDVESKARAYMKAFETRDLVLCMNYFTDTSAVHFVNSVYNGMQEIEEWHKARFAADLRMVRMGKVTVEGNTVVLEGIVTSKRLKAWKINTVSGTVTAQFDGDKITEVKFGTKML